MKLNRNYQFIIISSIALLIVLVIQVSWIFETARIREELFNEKANMVLSKTADALSKDPVTYRNMELCMGRNEVRKVDSLLTHYMQVYNIHIDHYFEVKPNAVNPQDPPRSTFPAQAQGCYFNFFWMSSDMPRSTSSCGRS